MASSNVKYYEKQKEFQDTITSCEQQRMNLERQFHLALQADQTSSRMTAARLHTYWKKICEDERRAKQRNEMLMREFERIDAHMSEMNARTQRLAIMKKQYEDYISRTYPEWNELMYGSPQQEEPSRNQPQKETSSSNKYSKQSQESAKHQHPEVMQETQDIKKSEIRVTVPDTSSDWKVKDEQQQQHWQNQQRQQQEQIENYQKQQKQNNQLPEKQSYQQQQKQIYQQTQSHQQQQNYQQQQQQQQTIQEKTISAYQNKTSQHQTHGDGSRGSGIYANLPEKRSEYQNLQSDEKLDTSPDGTKEQEDEDMSQPIRSVEISSKTLGRTIQTANTAMQPKDEEEDEDEETSEFGTDSELPMGQSLGNTQIRVDSQVIQEKNNSKSKFTGSIKPELSVDGLKCLLHLVEADIADSFSQEGYYRSSWPDSAVKNDIIRKANADEDLSRIDVNLISMVILEQTTLIVRNLTEKCVLPESLLQGDLTTLSATKLRQHLSPEAQMIWDALYSHFVKLVKDQVMEPPELSAIFTPCLVADGGSQDKGHMFIVQLLDEIRTNANDYTATKPNWNKASISPAQTMEGSGSFVEDGRVPPLKFGSLLDKPLSDDESSYINSSLPRDSVPLNETAAYKSMVSGSSAGQRRQSSAQEDTDDDVEKQIASALVHKPVNTQPSPRKPMVEMDEPSEMSSQTQQTSPHVYVPTAMESKGQTQNLSSSGPPKFQGVKISSDLDTDTEVDAGIFGSSRQPENNYDFDFYD